MTELENKENIENTEAIENLETKDTTEQPAQLNTEQRKLEKKAKKEERKKKMYRQITVILLIVIIILILLLLHRCSSDMPVLNPDFPPQDTEENAYPFPDDGEDVDYGEGGGVRLQLSDKLTIDLSDKQAVLFFANPIQSSENMVLWIMVQDVSIARSGLILPGYQIDKLDLLEDAEKMLSEGIYSGKFVIYCYDPVTNERVVVNTEFPVTITVNQ